MKKLKNNLDEMQELNMLHIEKMGFWMMYWGLFAAIVIQLLVYQEHAMKYTAGETIVFLAGSICVIAAEIRKGLWDRRIPATPMANLLLSIIISGIFAIILIIVKYVQYGSLPGAIAAGVVYFIFIAVACYGALTFTMMLYKKKKKKLEEDMED